MYTNCQLFNGIYPNKGHDRNEAGEKPKHDWVKPGWCQQCDGHNYYGTHGPLPVWENEENSGEKKGGEGKEEGGDEKEGGKEGVGGEWNTIRGNIKVLVYNCASVSQ